MYRTSTVITPNAAKRERRIDSARKRIVKYVFLVYWLLIFEGALRKWAFPQYHEVIFFARDPIVLLIYILAWRNNFFKKDGYLTIGMAVSMLFLPLIFFQLVVIDMHPLTLIYGWRMYFAYLPLIFVIKEVFHQDDIFRLIRQTLYISIPLSVLVFFQYISPPQSFINAAYSDGFVFIVANNIVRTTGTFSFTAGQTMYAASLVAMLIIAWFYRKRAPLLSMPWLLLATIASITTLLLSGSRTAFFMAGLVVVSAFIGLTYMRGISQKATGIVLLLLLIGVGTLLFLGPFRDSFDALGTRFQQAEHAEGSTWYRAFYPLFAFTDRIITTSPVGHGVGYGTSGGSRIATGKSHIILPEDEWSRVVMEAGPVFGMMYIGYRILFTLFIARRCIRSSRANNLIPMIFFGFIGFYLLAGNITQTGSVHGYNWIFVGLTLAAMKIQFTNTNNLRKRTSVAHTLKDPNER